MKPDQPTRVRLGAFELDLKTGELCPVDPSSNDAKLLLQEQPFRVLRILIESRGEIATREEIKRRLWPNDTIVDFDHSINVAIGTLRRALGDSAGQPSYIETVARRGYRLLVLPEPVAAREGKPQSAIEDEPESPSPAGGLIGRKVSHFRVLEVIGGGGMGMVYKAEDLKLGAALPLSFYPRRWSVIPLPQAFSTRSTDGILAESSQHMHHLRDRRVRGPAHPRDGIAGRRDAPRPSGSFRIEADAPGSIAGDSRSNL
jgi:DNA-binding winged helix-turn-helix (wHTH) protein